MAFFIPSKCGVNETVEIPHPYDRNEIRSWMGEYTPAELDRLIEEYKDYGYRARRTHDEDGVVTWSLNIGTKVKITLLCYPVDYPVPAGLANMDDVKA